MDPFEKIIEIAKQQHGYVGTFQVSDVKSQIFVHHEKVGNLERIIRGVYRATSHPLHEDGELIEAWLWSKGRGVISHESALSILELSDILPATIHLTVPDTERPIRRETPASVKVHFGDVPDEDRQWHGVVPMTTVRRTLIDVAQDTVDPDQLELAVGQAKALGLVGEDFEQELIRELIMRRRL